MLNAKDIEAFWHFGTKDKTGQKYILSSWAAMDRNIPPYRGIFCPAPEGDHGQHIAAQAWRR
jgi:hypothetical protein